MGVASSSSLTDISDKCQLIAKAVTGKLKNIPSTQWPQAPQQQQAALPTSALGNDIVMRLFSVVAALSHQGKL